MKFSKKDLLFSIFTGLGTGLIVWRILEFLNIPEIGKVWGVICVTYPCGSFDGIPWSFLVILVPVLWILGVNLGYFLGRWVKFFNQFGKFAAIGFTNAAVDFGILNFLIASTGIATGGYYSIFKTVSFFIALINSYFLNKHWAFEANHNGAGGIEFVKFAGVAIVAALVNVGVASFVVNFIDPILGFSDAIWANIGAIAGSASALVFSFIGFKLLVFKTQKPSI